VDGVPLSYASLEKTNNRITLQNLENNNDYDFEHSWQSIGHHYNRAILQDRCTHQGAPVDSWICPTRKGGDMDQEAYRERKGRSIFKHYSVAHYI
jgi:hypothetical protein